MTRKQTSNSPQKRQRLTPKQEAFAAAYVETGNAAEAYKRAYDVDESTSSNTVYVQASRLLDNPKIALRIAELQREAAERAVVSKERVLRELARIAFTDIGDYVQWDARGNVVFTPSEQLPQAKRAAVKKLSVKRRRMQAPDGPEEWEIEEASLELWSKEQALQSLGKHLGLFIERLEHSGPNGGPLEARIVEHVITDPGAAELAHRLLERIAGADGDSGRAGVRGEPGEAHPGAARSPAE